MACLGLGVRREKDEEGEGWKVPGYLHLVTYFRSVKIYKDIRLSSQIKRSFSKSLKC